MGILGVSKYEYLIEWRFQTNCIAAKHVLAATQRRCYVLGLQCDVSWRLISIPEAAYSIIMARYWHRVLPVATTRNCVHIRIQVYARVGLHTHKVHVNCITILGKGKWFWELECITHKISSLAHAVTPYESRSPHIKWTESSVTL